MSDTIDTDLGPLEDIDLSEDQDETVEESTEVEESTDSTEETEETQASEETDESEATEEETEGEADTEVEAETEETNPEEARKEVARQAYERRQEARLQRQDAIEQARIQELQALRDQGADEEQLAIRDVQFGQYKNTVNANFDTLSNQLQQAKQIETFKTDNPIVQKYFDDAVDEFEAKYVTIDNLGNARDVRGDLYDFLNNKASLLEDYKADLARSISKETKKNFAKQKAAVTPKPTTRRTETVDPYLDAFQEEANR